MRKQIWNRIEKIAYAILKKMFGVLHKELSDETFEACMQFLKFGIVGVSSTIISYLLYAVSLFLLRYFGVSQKIDYLAAQVIAFMLSVLWSFWWNSQLVFVPQEGKERSWIRTLVKTYISYSFTGLFLNSVLLVLWVSVLHISEYVAPLMNLVISVPINFLVNKFWAFKNNK